MEYENKYGASKGVAGAGLGLGIAGTALGVMAGGLNGIGGILGGGRSGCGEHVYSRYDAEKDARIAELETEVKLRDANTFTMGEMGKLRDYVDGKFAHVEQQLCDQRVYNTANTTAVTCIQGQVAQLMSLTKLVVPNGSICPGWGDVTVSVTPAATPTTGA
jgi:hypothetical protein